MNWLRNFFSGRYGMDGLNIALVIFALLLSFAVRIVLWFLLPFFWWLRFLYIIAYIPVAVAAFRMLSRNVGRRSRENEVFMGLVRKITGRSRDRKAKVQDKEHRYYKCPSCGAQLRVPKGKGKIRITCPQCRREFVKKT